MHSRVLWRDIWTIEIGNAPLVERSKHGCDDVNGTGGINIPPSLAPRHRQCHAQPARRFVLTGGLGKLGLVNFSVYDRVNTAFSACPPARRQKFDETLW